MNTNTARTSTEIKVTMRTIIKIVGRAGRVCLIVSVLIVI